MYLFRRRARLQGSTLVESMGWATRIAQHVGQVSELRAGVFTTVFGPEVSTVVWSAFVEGLQSLQDSFDKLMADKGYLALLADGAKHVLPGTVDDSLHLVLHGEPEMTGEVNYVVSVRTTMVGGGLSRGVPLGIEIAEHSERITGRSTLFVIDTAGNYGGVGWMTPFTSAAELEQAQLALNGDPSFVEFLDANVNGVYSSYPGATRQEILRRIG